MEKRMFSPNSAAKWLERVILGHGVLRSNRIRNNQFACRRYTTARKMGLDRFVEELQNEVKADKSQEKQKLLVDLKSSFKSRTGAGMLLYNSLIEELERGEPFLYNPYRATVYNYEKTPQIISSNFWMLFKDVALSDLFLRRPPAQNVYTSVQIMRASEFIWNILQFKKIVDSGKLYIEDDGPKDEVLMRIYQELFCDRNAKTLDTRARDILIVANDRIHLMEVIKPDNTTTTIKAIKMGLYKACGATLEKDETLPLIPILTTASPVIWKFASKELGEISKHNKDMLERIKRALFAVCLDSYSPHKREDISINEMITNFDSSNRWLDKPLQIVVNNSGRAGAVCNLNCINIRAISRLCNYIVANEPVDEELFDSDRIECETPEQVKFDLNDKIREYIEDAKGDIRKYVYDIVSCMGHVQNFSQKYLDDVIGTDLHSFILLAVSIAWYRLKNCIPRCAFIYDVNTENYHASVLSRVGPEITGEFATSYDNDDVSYKDKLTLFKDAVRKIGELQTNSTFIPDLLEQADSLANFPAASNDQRTLKRKLVSLLSDNVLDIDVHLLQIDKNHFFTAGIAPRHQKSLTMSYSIYGDKLTFAFTNYKKFGKQLCFQMRMELIRAIKDIMLIHPSKRDVWGGHSKIEKKLLDRQNGILQVHKMLNDKYLQREDYLHAKYRKFLRTSNPKTETVKK